MIVFAITNKHLLSNTIINNIYNIFINLYTNPALTVLDIEKFANAAHAHGVPLIVDNTFPTPINCRPFEWGADIVTHSTTKYMDGHGAALGGAVVDSGNFDWMAHAEKFGKEGAFITKWFLWCCFLWFKRWP